MRLNGWPLGANGAFRCRFDRRQTLKFKSSLAAAVMVAVATSVAPIAQADTAALFLNAQGEPTLAPVIQEIGPAVVNIATIGFVMM